MEDGIVYHAEDQRDALEGEPKCVVCGRYGEYVCDETDQDVCSLDCKKVHLDSLARDSTSISPKEDVVSMISTLSSTWFPYYEDNAVSSIDSGGASLLRQKLLISLSGPCTLNPILSFDHIHLGAAASKIGQVLEGQLKSNLSQNGFVNPTPIQKQVIPIVLSGCDVIGSAPTGSGKTLSFVVPAICHIINYKHTASESSPLVLILSPTRELCMQIEDATKLLAKTLPLKTALLVGGMPLPPQLHRLTSSISLIVATPGRLVEILTNHSLSLASISLLIIDEMDVMLSSGFQKDLNFIMSHIRNNPHLQTLLFSATISKEVEKHAMPLLKNPTTVTVGRASNVPSQTSSTATLLTQPPSSLVSNTASSSTNTSSTSIDQVIFWVKESHKKDKLRDLLMDADFWKPPIIVFVESRLGAEMLADAISKMCQIDCRAIHGEKKQDERTRTLNDFIHGEFPVIIATGVLGRGIDLLSVSQVVIFDYPHSVDEYIHQIGRAGRLQQSGLAVTFINNENKALFPDMYTYFKQNRIHMPPELIHSSFLRLPNKRQKT